ncbi:MAG: discoidin domain-containing protein, partial [Clostridia bacterium]|nr:discoidin domain-containing protein [Clostridia bacterium]
EDISCGGFNGYQASRISAWKANLCGSYGFTYGVTGVWANNYSTEGNTGWLGTYSYEPWYMGIDKPGSYEMKYMADFFRYADFSRLVPRFSDTAFSDLTDEKKAVASSDNSDTYIAYFYNRDLTTGELRGLNKKATYSAKWYNPLTGCFVEISGSIKAPKGTYVIPQKPTAGDWALLVTSRTDLGPYVTEKAYTDSLIVPEDSQGKAISYANNENRNILRGASATASSISSENSNASKSIDGDPDTWWCASNNSVPQTLTYELKEEASFNTFVMQMYPGTSGVSYTLECSNDGQRWKKIYIADDEPANSYGNVSLFSFDLGTEQTCRFIRITFNKVTGNWAAVIDAAAYVAHISDTLPVYEGKSVVPSSVKCTGSYIYSSGGKARDTVYALFDGKDETRWSPYAPIGSQTILMDLGDVNHLYGINIKAGKKALIPNYRIEGSKDGKVWTIIADATLRDKNIVYTGDDRIVTEALSGNYRYVKLLWLNLGSNNADKSIAGIELFTCEATPEETEKPGGNSSAGSNRNNAKAVVIPIIAALAAGGAAAVAAVTVRKKRRKE